MPKPEEIPDFNPKLCGFVDLGDGFHISYKSAEKTSKNRFIDYDTFSEEERRREWE